MTLARDSANPGRLMRVFLSAVALCLLSFAAGVVGDLSVASTPRPSAVVRLPPIPPNAVRAHPLPPLSGAHANRRAYPQRARKDERLESAKI